MPPGKCVQKHPLFKGNIMSEDFQKLRDKEEIKKFLQFAEIF